MIERKSWGFVVHGEVEQVGEFFWKRRDLAFVAPGGYSSIHLHCHIANAFRVLYGSITVERFDEPLDTLTNSSIGRMSHLGPSQGRIFIPEDRPHRFRAGNEGAVIEEVYTCEAAVFAWRVTRFSEGGIAK